ncbi:MAG: nucleotidyltransferase [Acetobacterium sp.]
MKILGIISEYNPFHTGHAFQLETTKKICAADAVMTLMSGSITQRGDFAIINKWKRAQLALASGVDLVCELPFGYACQSAEAFAQGGVKILNATGACDFLSFGSELGKLEPLKSLAQILVAEPPEFKDLLTIALGTGVSFPKAREQTIDTLLGQEMSSLLASPNNILAVEYLKALLVTKSSITPITVKRQGAGYHSLDTKDFLSATGIRKILLESFENDHLDSHSRLTLENSLPYSIEVLLASMKNVSSQGDQDFLNALRLMILSRNVIHLKNTPYVSEGLEHKIRDALKTEKTLAALVAAIISKRIPKTRVQRILCNRILELNKQTLLSFQHPSFTPYLRVLGFNSKGQSILKKIKKQGEIPILTNISRGERLLSPAQQKMLYYDIRSTDLHNLFYEKDYRYHRDYTTSPIRI